MNANFSLSLQQVHLWSVWLPDFNAGDFAHLLNADEANRAARFHFEIHRQRYTIARGILREILSRYTQIPAQEIIFSYGPRGKPYLENNSLSLQFNVSHSHDFAVYALTMGYEIGVDIEKIEEKYKDSVAKRFFSPDEYEELNQLPEAERCQAFYKIWAAKEALIKAVGEGLYVELDSFSVSTKMSVQTILFSHATFHIENFLVHPDYQSAFATAQSVEKVIYQTWLPT